MEKPIQEEELQALIQGINIFKKNVYEEGKLFNQDITIPNIGITFYNKLNSIVKQYRDHGLDFYNSHLLSPLLNRMAYFMDAAMNTMEKYQANEEKILKGFFFKKRKYLDVLNEFAITYTNIDNELYMFSIEKDITNAVLYDMLIHMDDENSVYQDTNIFLLYEQELITLGLNESALSLRQKFEQIQKELTETNEEKVLKK